MPIRVRYIPLLAADATVALPSAAAQCNLWINNSCRTVQSSPAAGGHMGGLHGGT